MMVDHLCFGADNEATGPGVDKVKWILQKTPGTDTKHVAGRYNVLH